MANKRVRLTILLNAEALLFKRLSRVTVWTPESARIAVALNKLHGHIDNSVYEIPEDEWEELKELSY